MQLLVLIIRDKEKIDELLLRLSNEGMSGATLLDCEGMAERLIRMNKKEDIPLFELFESILQDGESTGKMLLMVLTDEKIERARCIIRDFIGGLDKPNTGLMFGIPLSFTEGLKF